MMLVLLFAFVSRSMITEQNLGVSDDHTAIISFIEQKIKDSESKLTRKEAREAKRVKPAS